MTEQVGASVVMFGLHRGGSSITCRLLQLILRGAGYELVDQAKSYYEAGYVTDDIPQEQFAALAPAGTFYGPFRSYPLTMRLANLSGLTRILVVRDPRDCLVSSYYALRSMHDRGDLRRAKVRLPTQLDVEDTVEDFCIRNADPARRDLESMRLLCLQYPDTLVFRYEDIYRDPSGWLDGIIAHLGLQVPEKALAQARVEAVFRAEGEDVGRHHRQGWPGDHQRKLARQTALYLTEYFAEQLAFFSYGGNIVRASAWGERSAAEAPRAAENEDLAALKRIVKDLQRENGHRIREIATLRQTIAALGDRPAAAGSAPAMVMAQ